MTRMSFKKNFASPPGQPAPPRQSPRVWRCEFGGFLKNGGLKISPWSALFGGLTRWVRPVLPPLHIRVYFLDIRSMCVLCIVVKNINTRYECRIIFFK